MSSESARPTLSLIVPVYNEEAVLPELARRLRHFLGTITQIGERWEVILVDDGSIDRSRELLREMGGSDARFCVVGLSRNFGHQNAITAGLDFARGEAVVIMDADLQDPPEVVHAMLERWRAGFDVVYAVRQQRQGESIFKRATAAVFYRMLRALVGVSIPIDAGDFRLVSRKVVLTMRALRESHRFVRGMVAWIGFAQCAVSYERQPRHAGETKYPLRKMVRFAIDGITSFSTVPLRLATWLGCFAGLVALGAAGWAVFEKLYGRGTVPGWTTIMIAVALGSAAQLLMTGILGEYVGRIYEEVKRRPLYIVNEVLNVVPESPSDRP